MEDIRYNAAPSSFINSVTKKKVRVFVDVPHCIKLMRNHLIDKGFINLYYPMNIIMV